MYNIKKLKNGTTLITVPIKGTEATTVLCMFPVGSRYETEKISGASHFVEHLMFKGTTKRPTSQEITRTLDAVGAQYNAFTAKEYTGYYVKIAGKKQEVAFDILSDIIFNSQFKIDEVEKEKGAIVEELRMYNDNPLMDIDDIFECLLFKGNELGWHIGGTEETVRGVSRDELWEYYQKHYSAKNMVLVIAGDVEKKKMGKMADYFASQPSPEGATGLSYYKKEFTPFALPVAKRPLVDRVVVKEKKVDQTQLILGFPGLRHNHPDRFAAGVLAAILGGGMSSRLFSEVREKRGLAYMVRALTTAYRDTGVLYIKAGLDPARLPEAVKVINEELQKITEEPVLEKELEDAKNYLIGHMALDLEDSFNQASWYAEKFLFAPKIETYEQVVKQVKKVTVKQVQRVAKELIKFDQMYLAAIGSFTKEAFLKIL